MAVFLHSNQMLKFNVHSLKRLKLEKPYEGGVPLLGQDRLVGIGVVDLHYEQ